MTDRMDSTLRHIESAVDVDEWAAKICRDVFEGWDNIKEQIAQFKHSLESKEHNRDYITGYLCALSAVEGMIAELGGE